MQHRTADQVWRPVGGAAPVLMTHDAGDRPVRYPLRSVTVTIHADRNVGSSIGKQPISRPAIGPIRRRRMGLEVKDPARDGVRG